MDKRMGFSVGRRSRFLLGGFHFRFSLGFRSRFCMIFFWRAFVSAFV
jgi:hypothetical protein